MSSVDVLFVPASGHAGSGEAQNLAILAEYLTRRTGLRCALVLAEATARSLQTPVPCHLLTDSPTRCSAQVEALFAELRPRLVVFDATCRRRQLLRARALGALCAFVYIRNKSLMRAMRPGKLGLWHALLRWGPIPTSGPASWWVRLRCRFAGVPAPVSIGVITHPPDPSVVPRLLAAVPWRDQPWWMLCPGGTYGSSDFRQVAQGLLAQGHKVVLCTSQPQPSAHPNLVELGRLPNPDLLGLLDAATYCITNGGGLLLQAIALGQRPYAVALTRDQPARIRAMAHAGLCTAWDATQGLPPLLQALPVDRSRQRAQAAPLGLRLGADAAVDHLLALLQRPA